MTYRYFFNVYNHRKFTKRWLCSTLVFAHTVIVIVYILSLFIFNKTVLKKDLNKSRQEVKQNNVRQAGSYQTGSEAEKKG
jgi:hypothetical protein